MRALEKFREAISARVEAFGEQYVAFGIFGTINYLLFYCIWKYLSLQSYESLTLRLIATAACIPLIFKDYWPRKLRRWLPVYWYFTLWFCLPFFFTFLLLKNQLSNVWLMSTTIVMVWLMLLVDWVSFIFILASGVLAAWISYEMTTTTHFQDMDYLGLASQYFGTLAVVLIFARNKEKIEKIKIKTIQAIGASIAHELRTPLRAISAGLSGIQRFYPDLIKTYQIAKAEKLQVPYIPPSNEKVLPKLLDNSIEETKAAFNIIDMLLTKADLSRIRESELETCSIAECVEESLMRYPFHAKESKLIHWNKGDFLFKGNKLLIVHVIFNLLKNSLYYIKAAGKGEIYIDCQNSNGTNTLVFKDTGTGISEKILPKIFDKFFTNTTHGTGVGLYFCKIVLENLGGNIRCDSKEGEFTSFIMTFPLLKKQKE